MGGCSRAASPDHIRAANLIAIWLGRIRRPVAAYLEANESNG